MLKAAAAIALILSPPLATSETCQWSTGDGMYAGIDFETGAVDIEWQSGVTASCHLVETFHPTAYDLGGCEFEPNTLVLVPDTPYTRAENFDKIVLANQPMYWQCAEPWAPQGDG